MKKAISSVLICIALLLNLTAPVMASTNASTDVNRIELVYLTNDNSRASENGNGTPFVVKQYQGNQVVQEVTGYVGGPTIQIIDYYNGKIIKQTTRNVSDFVSKISETPSDSSNATSDYGSYLGRIIYNKASGSNEEREITVYSKQTYFNEESFRIHAEATDTISSPVSATRQRTLKPQRFQGSFCAIWAGVFPLFFPLQIFKGNFQGVQPPQRCAAQAARMSGKPTPQTDFQHLGKGSKSASACRFGQHPGPPGTCAALLDKETTVVGKSNNGGHAGDMAPVSESDTRAAAAPAGVPTKFCGYLRRR